MESPLHLAARAIENLADLSMLAIACRMADGSRQTVASGEALRELARPFARVRTPEEAAGLRRFNQRRMGPMGLRIIGATDYWLEGAQGIVVGERSPTSEPALARVLQEIAAGTDPDELSLVCDVKGLGRYVVACGIDLVGVAEAAAGIPRRPHRYSDDEDETAADPPRDGIGVGPDLQDIAEAAAGRPAEPRVPQS
jgi:hypothetical protein